MTLDLILIVFNEIINYVLIHTLNSIVIFWYLLILLNCIFKDERYLKYRRGIPKKVTYCM